ncbi:MAG: hypothetical protein D6713_05220 [Deltaproteobacteria bacterium]|nr:MAG: hypothetical protein D6713_05220 [Deltaproteobacteria bacterium]
MKRIVSVILFLLLAAGTVFAETHGEGHGGGLPWWDIFKQAVNFTILVAVLVYFLRKPLSQFLKERKELLIKAMEEAEKANKEAREKLSEVEEKLNKLGEEVEKLNRSMEEEAEREAERIKELSRKEIERIKEQTEFAAQQELKKAKEAIQREAAELAVKTASDIITRSITDEDQKRFIEESIEKIKEVRK